MVSSKSALARAMGVSTATIRNWMKHPDWPFGKDGPWDPDAVRSYRRDRLAALDDPSKILRQQKVAQTRLTRLKADILEGKFIPRELYEQGLKMLADTFVQSLQNLESALPALVADRSPPEVEEILGREFDHARASLVRQADQEMKATSLKGAKTKSGGKGRPGRKSKSRVK